MNEDQLKKDLDKQFDDIEIRIESMDETQKEQGSSILEGLKHSIDTLLQKAKHLASTMTEEDSVRKLYETTYEKAMQLMQKADETLQEVARHPSVKKGTEKVIRVVTKTQDKVDDLLDKNPQIREQMKELGERSQVIAKKAKDQVDAFFERPDVVSTIDKGVEQANQLVDRVRGLFTERTNQNNNDQDETQNNTKEGNK